MSEGPIIRAEGLAYDYSDGVTALRGVSFDVRRGEKVGIVGPNGAGKSTLLLHLNGIRLGSGQIEVDGLAVRGENLRQVRARVGLVFQDPDDQLFCPTVFDDVAFAPMNLGLPEDEVRSRVAASLEKVDLEGYESRSPFHLSLGEKKRVTIATVLSHNPEILALDEPTSNLDPRNRRRVIQLLKELPQTILVATHDLDLAYELCHRCLVLNRGLLAAEGPAETILGDETLMSANGLEVPLKLLLDRLRQKS